MPQPGRQRFPTWWQALILVVSGVVIGFSSCVGALQGLNGGPQPFAKLFAIGFIAGVAAFFVGIILFLVVIVRAVISPVSPPGTLLPPPSPAGVISRATHPQLFPDAPQGAARASVPSMEVGQEANDAMVRLRIAIVIAIAFAGAVLLRGVAGPASTRGHNRFTLLILVLMFVLGQLPYAIVLFRTRKYPDRVGLALAMGTGGAYALTSFGFLFRYVTAMNRMYPWLFFGPILGVAVFVFALLARSASAQRSDDTGLVVSFFFGLVSYNLILHWGLTYFVLRMAFR